MESELVYETGIKKKKNKLYFLDKDGDVCETGLCEIIGVEPVRYREAVKIKKIGIKREKGFSYSVGKDGNIYRSLIKGND